MFVFLNCNELEQFSTECRKTKTKVITVAIYKGRKYFSYKSRRSKGKYLFGCLTTSRWRHAEKRYQAYLDWRRLFSFYLFIRTLGGAWFLKAIKTFNTGHNRKKISFPLNSVSSFQALPNFFLNVATTIRIILHLEHKNELDILQEKLYLLVSFSENLTQQTPRRQQ